jgi:hypothetical protein
MMEKTSCNDFVHAVSLHATATVAAGAENQAVVVPLARPAPAGSQRMVGVGTSVRRQRAAQPVIDTL